MDAPAEAPEAGAAGSAESGPPSMVLEAQAVLKRYGDRLVLDRIDLRVDRGELVAILGRSGSGKSTLINILSGLDRPDEGRVRVREMELTALEREDRAEFRLANIGIVFQHFNLIPDLTVLENVALPLRLAHVRREDRDSRAADVLRLFGIDELSGRFPDGLSGGELQRVAVARALAPQPAVVLADEPTANLDDDNARQVLDALRTAGQAGAGVVVASHDPLAADAADRRLRIASGRLVEG